MGSPVSPVLANIFMEYTEEAALNTSPSPIRFWRRYMSMYVNNTCFLQKTAVNMVLNYLNGIPLSITFTMEKESDGKLPFLDAVVIRKEDGTLEVGVYRKQTHIDRYLLLKSHHLLNVKRGVVQCLMKTAQEITTEEHLQKKEIQLLRAVLRGNAHLSNLVKPSTECTR